MDKLKEMKLFCAVVEEGSFAGAAKKVSLTPAMVGRHIAAIEEQLGFVLLNRSTRKMQLTQGGEAYYRGCQKIISDVTELEESLVSAHQTNPKGIIRLTAPNGLGSPFLVDAINEFRKQFPDIHFDLRLSNAPLDLVEEHIDLSLRLSFSLEDSSLVAATLGHTSFGLYATQEYLEQNGVPKSLEDLKQHQCLHMGSSRYGDFWSVMVDGKVVNFRQPWVLVVESTEAMIHAVAQGMGIAMVPRIFAESHIESHKLVALEGVVEFPQITLYGLYPTRKHLPYRVQLFLDFLRSWSKEYLAGRCITALPGQ